MNRIHAWLIRKVVGRQPVIANLEFPISIPAGTYTIKKTILTIQKS